MILYGAHCMSSAGFSFHALTYSPSRYFFVTLYD